MGSKLKAAAESRVLTTSSAVASNRNVKSNRKTNQRTTGDPRKKNPGRLKYDEVAHMPK